MLYITAECKTILHTVKTLDASTAVQSSCGRTFPIGRPVLTEEAARNLNRFGSFDYCHQCSKKERS